MSLARPTVTPRHSEVVYSEEKCKQAGNSAVQLGLSDAYGVLKSTREPGATVSSGPR